MSSRQSLPECSQKCSIPCKEVAEVLWVKSLRGDDLPAHGGSQQKSATQCLLHGRSSEPPQDVARRDRRLKSEVVQLKTPCPPSSKLTPSAASESNNSDVQIVPKTPCDSDKHDLDAMPRVSKLVIGGHQVDLTYATFPQASDSSKKDTVLATPKCAPSVPHEGESLSGDIEKLGSHRITNQDELLIDSTTQGKHETLPKQKASSAMPTRRPFLSLPSAAVNLDDATTMSPSLTGQSTPWLTNSVLKKSQNLLDEFMRLELDQDEADVLTIALTSARSVDSPKSLLLLQDECQMMLDKCLDTLTTDEVGAEARPRLSVTSNEKNSQHCAPVAKDASTMTDHVEPASQTATMPGEWFAELAKVLKQQVHDLKARQDEQDERSTVASGSFSSHSSFGSSATPLVTPQLCSRSIAERVCTPMLKYRDVTRQSSLPMLASPCRSCLLGADRQNTDPQPSVTVATLSPCVTVGSSSGLLKSSSSMALLPRGTVASTSVLGPGNGSMTLPPHTKVGSTSGLGQRSGSRLGLVSQYVTTTTTTTSVYRVL